MTVIDLLVTIVVVTILVTIILAVVTYVAYKLRMAREPSELDKRDEGLRYFIRFDPEPDVAGAGTASLEAREGHATEA